jgi:hypothetical protein
MVYTLVRIRRQRIFEFWRTPNVKYYFTGLFYALTRKKKKKKFYGSVEIIVMNYEV